MARKSVLTTILFTLVTSQALAQTAPSPSPSPLPDLPTGISIITRPQDVPQNYGVIVYQNPTEVPGATIVLGQGSAIATGPAGTYVISPEQPGQQAAIQPGAAGQAAEAVTAPEAAAPQTVTEPQPQPQPGVAAQAPGQVPTQVICSCNCPPCENRSTQERQTGSRAETFLPEENTENQ